MAVLTAVDPDSVEGPLKTLFDQAERSLKHVPTMLRLMANSPPILEAYLHVNQAFHQTKLTARLNVLIAVTVAELSGCDYMLSRAKSLGRQRGVTEEELNEARRGEAAEAGARAVLRFAIAVIQERGRVPASAVDELRRAGYDDQEIVEVIAAVGLNVFRTISTWSLGLKAMIPQWGPETQRPLGGSRRDEPCVWGDRPPARLGARSRSPKSIHHGTELGCDTNAHGRSRQVFGLIFAIAFSSFLIVQQSSLFCALVNRTRSVVFDVTDADVWVMDPATRYIDEVYALKNSDVDRVRGVAGVRWAVPFFKGTPRAIAPDGKFRVTALLGIDDASLAGAPRRDGWCWDRFKVCETWTPS